MEGIPPLAAEENKQTFETDDFVFRLMRSVVADKQVRDTRASLGLIAKEPKHRLTIDSFADLFDVDTTFGGFGMPVAQQDPFLHRVALTAFQPYDNDILKNGEDVVMILTPLYRILCVLTVVMLQRLGDIEDAEMLLPYKPRTQFSEARYASLLEVACSVWTKICHAYVSRFTTRVHEFYCFDVNGARAHCIWLDICCERILPGVVTFADICLETEDKRWVTVKSTTFGEKSPLNVTLIPGHNESTKNRRRLLYLFEGVTRTQIRHDNVGANEIVGETGHISFQRTEQVPYVNITQCDTIDSYFLLITFDGGHYSCFYRNVEGNLTAYPLYMHRMPEEESRLYDSSPTFSRKDGLDEHARLSRLKCCVCAKQGVALSRNDWDNTPDGETRLYCSKKCIAQMTRIQQDKARADEARQRKEESARKQFPSFAVRSAINTSI